jgi:hypothetical protein
MIDEPDQEEAHSDKDEIIAAEIAWHSKPLVRRERTPKLSGPEPKLTPEQKIAEQKRLREVLEASDQSSVDAGELPIHLSKIVEGLKDSDEDND